MAPAMDKWIEQRNKIMSPETMKIFNTQSLKDCGLDTITITVLNRSYSSLQCFNSNFKMLLRFSFYSFMVFLPIQGSLPWRPGLLHPLGIALVNVTL